MCVGIVGFNRSPRASKPKEKKKLIFGNRLEITYYTGKTARSVHNADAKKKSAKPRGEESSRTEATDFQVCPRRRAYLPVILTLTRTDSTFRLIFQTF